MKIDRFVDLNVAEKILGQNSSYALRSLEYYRSKERKDGDDLVGDTLENNVILNKKSTTHYYSRIGQYLISCWSILGSEDVDIDWTSSPYFGGAAICSTTEKVVKKNGFLRRRGRSIVRFVGLAF